MTQEEKQLLLKDLCARLPYGVKVESIWKEKLTDVDGYEGEITTTTIELINNDEIDCKPYLRPMSSMTEEEKEEIRLYFRKGIDELKGKPNDEQFIIGFCQDAISLDWLIAHHFDYRGLIPMGLALEAPEDMYK